ncbi:hypothetical protein [Pseudomonas luteola]|uniref:hypothetical protein n=1 Tax=Pseudomonas luteola TaxID=47886 RepID=UPI00123BCA38|nr:hypothetical protein [Pseudomonas luteola]QEU31467.1 hypothetical protein FOB45_27275 [Pseudomonas luteola]
MKVLDYGAERKWQGLSALSVPLLPKPRIGPALLQPEYGSSTTHAQGRLFNEENSLKRAFSHDRKE